MDAHNSKLCSRCGQRQSLDAFGRNAGRKDGVTVYCRPCTIDYASGKQYDKQRWAKNREGESLRNAAYRLDNAERLAAYYREKGAKYRAAHPGKARASNIKRKHAALQATPAWADIHKINAFYQEAKRMEELDGILRHVDHVVPLKHPNVCGLHVEFNLQILTATENMSKHNRFTGLPECWE